ncbi:hypothetical protein DEIPH_ctg017orf0139 [Deinococcus phoenicis]|uniref:Peptidase M43 pregnancy-associated plasma-A domain-containing protein n=1 Tax=Deinococcus phoenicis TaxID=1476583 RepID=A0A016QSB0_9DEIO|nr:hypothetical protein [Deinococcus phoenicis]EYB68782.1 hypothetical protein DEIPH_ctg017orf0139 [Deinococcus phoenicis]
MKLRIAAATLLSASLLAACGPNNPTPPAGTQTDFGRLTTLKPGEQDTIRTALKVNVVFVGYRETLPGQVATARDVNTRDFQSILPRSYETIARSPSAYGSVEYTGNAFDYQYNYVFADQKFEDDFFGFLKASGSEQSLTAQQAFYNCQVTDVKKLTKLAAPLNPDTLVSAYACPDVSPNINREITGNLEIDAAKTENWLADNVARVGVKPGEYTVYLVNWYDRPDFKFHSYTRADVPDSDTGYRAGTSGSRRLIAWGGSTRGNQAAQRVWFYDLSANPDPWTKAYDVTHDDVDGDKEADYRMPPIWEYGTRKASIGYGRKVSPDLARVTRYAALNLLFTPSPIYRVTLTPPRMPEDIQLDLHVEQGEGAIDPQELLNAGLVQDRVSVLQPFTRFSNVVRQTPLDGDLADVYKCFFPVEAEDICSPEYADFSGEKLFQFGVKELRESYKTVPEGRYLLPVYAFNDNDDSQEELLGIAYDDGETGTQSFVYSFLTPSAVEAGYGFTDTTVHEVGHHLSLSHPHDGYDSEQDLSYGPSGDFYFTNVGDESASIMSYNDLAKTFGQFNLDAQYRYLTAAYLNNTNAVLEVVRRAGQASKVSTAAQSADSLFAQAEGKYDGLAYFDAAQLAHQGYRAVLDAALAAGVNVQPYKWYEHLSGLSTQSVKRKPRVSHTFTPQPGAVIFPEETREQRELRLAP